MKVTHFLPRAPLPDPELPDKQYAAEHCKQTKPAGVYDLTLDQLEAACRAAACVGRKGDAGYIVACAVDGSRSNANSAPASFLLIDQDGDGEEPDWKHLDQYQGFAWTTASHCPEVPSWRVVIPLTEPIAHGQMRSPFRGSYVRARSQPAFLPTHLTDVDAICWRRLAGTLTIDARELGGAERQFEERDDSLLAAAFAAAGLVEGPQAGGVRVICPWKHVHSDGQPGGTVVLHADPDGRGFGKFHCSRTECLKAKRTSWQALEAIKSLPAVIEELRHWPDPGLNNYERIDAPGAVVARSSADAPHVEAVDAVLMSEPLGIPEGQRATPETWGALMNARHTLLTSVGGCVRVLSWKENALGWRVPTLLKLSDFRAIYLNRQILVEGAKKPISAGDWWLSWPGRAEACSLTFAPETNARVVRGDVNLWRGWEITPVQGDCSRTLNFIRDIIAAGNPEHEKWILNWCAWVVQNPGKRAEVVLVLRGKKGTGKNTLFDTLKECFGQHAKFIANPKHLVGNFNAHLADCALLFANEAVAASDKTSDSVLKTLVTDSTLPIERKGVDIEMWPNRLSIGMASNEAWCVPAGLDERRYAVFDVSDAKAGDANREYYSALHAELGLETHRRGAAALLHHLLHRDLDGWHPRDGVPRTAALADNQLDGLRGADRVVYQMLATGEAHGFDGELAGLEAGCVFIPTGAVAEWNPKMLVAAAKALAVCGTKRRASVKTGFSARLIAGYDLPPLPQARETWAKSMRVAVTWDDTPTWTASNFQGTPMRGMK